MLRPPEKAMRCAKRRTDVTSIPARQILILHEPRDHDKKGGSASKIYTSHYPHSVFMFFYLLIITKLSYLFVELHI